MPPVESHPARIGWVPPDFELPAVNPDVDERGGAARRLSDYEDAAAVVVCFICNHCPYVVAIEDRLLARAYGPRGVRFIGVCSNDADRYPDDAPEALAVRAREKSYPFPYLHDADQEVARLFDAACTPEFFVLDGERRLVYRGRLDDGRPGREEVTRHDLRRALDELLETGAVTGEQWPALGCGIKWKQPAG
jgi:peroxiredoxin